MNAILSHSRRVLQIAAALFAFIAFVDCARADIFQWEYINPADPSQGKRQSTTLAPGGAGVDAVPGANLDVRNLTMAYLIGADLRNVYGYQTNLTNADLSQANLTNVYLYFATLSGAHFREANLTDANFHSATLTGADFTSAEVRGASFWGTGLTLTQLYSTASYQAHDLTGIGFGGNDLSGWNFAGQNLTNSNFDDATLSGADFTGAEVRGTSFFKDTFYGGSGITLPQLYSTASYQTHDLTGIGLAGNDMSGGNFAGQNLTKVNFSRAMLTGADFREATLTNADFVLATLTGADFSDAEILGTKFARSSITSAQLYSTANYKARELTKFNLGGNNLSGWNFAAQNLTEAYFGSISTCGNNGPQNSLCFASVGTLLTGADFASANVRGASFDGANLTDADFTGADVREASFSRHDVCPRHNCRLEGGITLSQLYSTASYQAKDLSGITLYRNDLAGGNFAAQCITNANFEGATLTHADFTAADARGAFLYPAGGITTNLIMPDGHIDGLDLDADGLFVVRDYDGDPRDTYLPPKPPIPIRIDEHMAMSPGGTLRMVFDADAWNSTISFAPASRSQSAARSNSRSQMT